MAASAPRHDRHDHAEVRDALGDLSGMLGDLGAPEAPASDRPATSPPPSFARVPPVAPKKTPARAAARPATTGRPAPAAAATPARRAPMDDPLAPVFAELASVRLEMERIKVAREPQGQGLEGWRFAVLLGLGLILLAAVVVQIVKA